MKQYQLIKAYKATEELSHNNKLPADVLWGIYKLRKLLSPHVDFQKEREEDLKKKYTEFADEEGNITGHHYTDYINDLVEIANIDKEIDLQEKIKLTIVDDLGISIEMMEDLEDFIEFTK